jgi:Family of unknown function (DUF6886)
MLFHISELGDIRYFEPRLSEGTEGPAVWAIDEARLRNYLLPRECPRVTFYAGRQTTAEDAARFLGSSAAVVAIESTWVERVRRTRVYCYHLRPETFQLLDECAGYHVSRVPVAPVRVEALDDLPAELHRRGVELRVVPNLWPLRDAVVASSLQFSMIRMRNALPREEAT